MNDTDTAVLGMLQEQLGDIEMHTPVEEIIATGRSRQRRRGAGLAAAGVAVAAGITVAALPSTGPPTQAGGVHINTVAYTVDSQSDGTIRVTWDKAQYFSDSAGLQAALRSAGFPVLIKFGQFCRGPQDGGATDPSGVAPGVSQVMKGEKGPDGKVTFVFTPSAMPAGEELFIGYLDAAQLAVTHGHPGSVERLVPVDTPLTCTTELPTGS